MAETAIAAAFERSSAKPRLDDKLYLLAVEMLKETEKPKAQFDLERCRNALDRAYQDLTGKLLGRVRDENQYSSAQQGERGQGGHENQTLTAASPPPLRDGKEGHRVLEPRVTTALTVAQPNALTASALKGRAEAAKVIAVTVLDTYRLSNGAIVGDLYWGSLHRLRAASARDMFLLRLLQNHATVSNPDNTKVREVVNADTLNRLLQKAAELADAM